jgi:drug/metabolite transporter (DMT)-like permease/rhodanese-related sulfurtransferase
MPFISVTELVSQLAQGKPLRLLDVRRDQAWAASGQQIAGGTWMNPALWLDWKDGVAHDLPIVLYCAHGHEISQGLTAALRAMGANACSLEGGFFAWQAQGQATTPIPAPRGASCNGLPRAACLVQKLPERNPQLVAHCVTLRPLPLGLADNPGMNRNVLYALGAATLFGASTPFAKLLGGHMPAVLLAGLLYLGSGLGLTLARCIRDGGYRAPGLAKGEWPWLLGAIFFGGVVGPVALMAGLMTTRAATASLLLNLEAVLTAVIAWVVFRENADRRIVWGMLAIVAGGVVLGWQTDTGGPSSAVGPCLVALACLCWAIDNNLTRKVSASDALFIASVKGVIAGTVNTALALALGATLPDLATLTATMVIGLLGYGISLVLFVLALRGLGTARTGAYFSTAPFMGAALALLVLGETTSWTFWLAAALMAWGVWLHLTEHHVHVHLHTALEHAHEHSHDEHHQHPHPHPPGSDGTGHGKHSHLHTHVAMTHSHPHYPDIHHRHTH